MGEKHRTYDKRVKCWVKAFFTALLDFANADDRVEWHSGSKLEVKRIEIETLVALRAKNFNGHPLKEWHVREALTHYLPIVLQILEDTRKTKRGKGSNIWDFKLTLWYECGSLTPEQHKQKNLAEFDRVWDEKTKPFREKRKSKSTKKAGEMEPTASTPEVTPVVPTQLTLPVRRYPKVKRTP